MKRLERQIGHLLANPVQGYTNAMNVNILADVTIAEDSPTILGIRDISLHANYPHFPEDDPNIGLEVFMEFRTLVGFMLKFGIQELADLEKITPAFLLMQYNLGKAIVFCSIGHNYLCFRKKGDKVIISDYGERPREVSVSLETDNDFIAFTNNCCL